MSVLMEQHEAHVARQKRLWFASPPKPRALIPPAPPPEEAPVLGVPVSLLGKPSALTIRRLVALKHDVKVSDLVGDSRARPLIAARDEAIRLVYTHCGPMSTPQLGRLFGSRDHSTVLHSLRKQGVPVLPPAVSYVSFWTDNPEAEDTLRSLWLSGSSIRQIAAELGVSRNAVTGRMRRMREDGRLPYGSGLSASTDHQGYANA